MLGWGRRVAVGSSSALVAVALVAGVLGGSASAAPEHPSTQRVGAAPAVSDPTGVQRMRACRPLGTEFASLEVAPEIAGAIPVSAGFVRLWDMKVAWKDVNPSPGTFDWTVLDERVRQAEASGAKVLLVLGLTPQWAAADPSAGDPRWGIGTASPPSSVGAWTDYVSAVAQRYGSRISAYEVWNEANLKTFWTGTPAGIADLARAAYPVIKAANPAAIVVAPSVTTRLLVNPTTGVPNGPGNPSRRFIMDMTSALAGGSPAFDAFAIHSYPAGNRGPAGRVQDVGEWQKAVVAALGASSPELDKPVWDTEVNYGLAGPGGIPGVDYTDAQGAELLKRTLADSRNLGIDATFWYLYSQSPFDLLGVQFWSGTPDTTAAWNAARSTYRAGANPCGAGVGRALSDSITGTPGRRLVVGPIQIGRSTFAAYLKRGAYGEVLLYWDDADCLFAYQKGEECAIVTLDLVTKSPTGRNLYSPRKPIKVVITCDANECPAVGGTPYDPMADYKAYPLKISLKVAGSYRPLALAPPCQPKGAPGKRKGVIASPKAKALGFCMDVNAFSRKGGDLKRVVLFVEDPRFATISR